MSDIPKTVSLNSDHKEALALLVARPEFKALEKLLAIEQNNILVQAWGIPASDPQLNIKKSRCEGMLQELQKIRKTFEVARKNQDE
jgi:hypothetical protein